MVLSTAAKYMLSAIDAALEGAWAGKNQATDMLILKHENLMETQQ